MSVLDTIRAATPTRKAVTMCLDGALQAEWDAALDALDAADADGGSLAKPDITAAVEHLESLRERVKGSEVTFLFAADNLSWGAYLRLQAEHQPREGNLLDRIRGFNVETFYPALLRATCLSVSGANGEPETPTEDVWVVLLGTPAVDETPVTPGSLNLTQVNRLIAGADYVMKGETAVPPSARSLLESQDFGASLAQPSPGASPPSGSKAGSPRTSRRSSTKKTASTKAESPAT